MPNLGFIGLGSMGTMLVEALLRTDAIPAKRLIVYNRTLPKSHRLGKRYPGITVAHSIADLVSQAKFVWICVPPGNVKEVLHEIQKSQRKDTVVVSLAASVTLDCLSSVVGVRVSRVIPSITAEVDEGVFLACHGELLDDSSSSYLERVLSHVGVVYPVAENHLELYTDITSCSPGIFSEIYRVFLQSARRFGPIDDAVATEMFVNSLSGTAKLYKDRVLSFEDMIKRVARKGGVTEVGISVVAERLPAVFDEVFRRTLENHAAKKKRMREDYGLAEEEAPG